MANSREKKLQQAHAAHERAAQQAAKNHENRMKKAGTETATRKNGTGKLEDAHHGKAAAGENRKRYQYSPVGRVHLPRIGRGSRNVHPKRQGSRGAPCRGRVPRRQA